MAHNYNALFLHLRYLASTVKCVALILHGLSKDVIPIFYNKFDTISLQTFPFKTTAQKFFFFETRRDKNTVLYVNVSQHNQLTER